MNQPQLPAHLQNRQSRHLAETAATGMGGALPPHISIRGNGFTLVDATGAEQPVTFVNPADGRAYKQPYLDLCIVDISDVMCKQYYDKDWTPDSNDPPVCWSANGVGPSRESSQPQCRTCAECPHNIRGSATSKISGVAIKACRDEKWLCVTLPGFGKDMLFQLKLTPGSFQNWKGYVEKFRNQPVDISDIVTRIEFEPDVNGVLVFGVSPAGYIDADTADTRERVLAAKATDIFVGRTDQPIQMLAAPVAQAQFAPPALPNQPAPVPLVPAAIAAPQPMPPQAFAPQTAPAAPPASFPGNAGFPQPSFAGTAGGGGPVGAPTGAMPTSPSEPARRRRRTAAQIAADNAANAATNWGAVPQPNPSVAPFRPAAPPQPGQPVSHPQPIAPPANPAPFGMAAGATPNPELAAMLNQHFGPPGGTAAGGGQR